MAYAWATAICIALPKPPFPGNIRGLNAWIACEKPAGQTNQWFNPLNTKQPGFGGTNALANGVKKYPTPVQGMAATVATLRNGYYPGILAAMNKPKGLADGILHDAEVRRNIGTWGTSVSCISSRLGGSSSKAAPAQQMGFSIPGSGIVKDAGSVGHLLTNLPHYLEMFGGGVILVFGVLTAVYGASGSKIIGKTVKKAAVVAAVA